jgi:hypothetical protein
LYCSERNKNSKGSATRILPDAVTDPSALSLLGRAISVVTILFTPETMGSQGKQTKDNRDVNYAFISRRRVLTGHG